MKKDGLEHLTLTEHIATQRGIASSLLNKFVKMDGRIRSGRDGEKKNLLKSPKDKKLWHI